MRLQIHGTVAELGDAADCQVIVIVNASSDEHAEQLARKVINGGLDVSEIACDGCSHPVDDCDCNDAADEPITEDWLRDVGFKWHQFGRQPDKHWLLWLGGALGQDRITSSEDLGIELAPAWWPNRNGDPVGDVGAWHCWLRGDTAGRYHRFIHVRLLRSQAELIDLVASLSGQSWDPANHFFGSIHTPQNAERIRRDFDRPDRQLTTGAPPYARWHEIEKDDTRGRALPEHMQAHADRQAGE